MGDFQPRNGQFVAMTSWWVFVMVVYVHPQAVPQHVIRVFETKERCEQVRWALQLKNAPMTYVQGCEPLKVER